MQRCNGVCRSVWLYHHAGDHSPDGSQNPDGVPYYAYEQAIILGGPLGNLWILFQWHLPLSLFFIILFGLFSGIFVGCLAMALAEVLRVIPIMVNRLQIQEGLPVLIGFIAAGKCLGTLFQYFFGKMG